jgi:flagellar motor component MotA
MVFLSFALIMGFLMFPAIYLDTLPMLFDLPSLVTVVGAAFLSVIAVHGFHVLKQMFQETCDETPYQTFAVVSLHNGIICSLVGIVASLGYVSDVASLGPALAVAILPLVYGGVFFLFAVLLEKRAKLRSRHE